MEPDGERYDHCVATGSKCPICFSLSSRILTLMHDSTRYVPHWCSPLDDTPKHIGHPYAGTFGYAGRAKRRRRTPNLLPTHYCVATWPGSPRKAPYLRAASIKACSWVFLSEVNSVGVTITVPCFKVRFQVPTTFPSRMIVGPSMS